MNIVDAIYHIKYNPFKYGEYIYCFYRHLENHDENILLLPLVIPLCTHYQFYAKKISRARFGSKQSDHIYSVFGNREYLYDLQDRVDNLKGISMLSLEYCLNQKWLYINLDDLNIYPGDDMDVKNFGKELKVAQNLAILFSKSSIDEIYSFLGVRL